MAQTPLFANLQTVAFSAWSAAPAGLTATSIGTKIGAPALLGVRQNGLTILGFSDPS
jgi:hypothetical protein